MTDSHLTQKALADIDMLKKAITRGSKGSPLSALSLRAHLLMNTGALFFVAVLAGYEFMHGYFTADLLASALAPELRREGINNVGIFLAIIIACSYAFLFLEAKEQKEPFDSFTARHFAYFKGGALLSDLLAKYAVFALVILAGKPEWVAALLMLFIADFVAQGRFFILPSWLALAGSAATFILSFYMFHHALASLLIPLAVFGLFAAASLAMICTYRARLAKGA